MNFDESIKYLLALGNEVLAMKLGLENVGKLLAALDNPEKNYLKVQIAGTNGKGSTCAFLEAISVAAGIKIGLTTSPHLISITERIKTNGREISEKDFARHATDVREISEKLAANAGFDQSGINFENVPTYFEQVTAIALRAFAEANCELVILETGLGGRFDATTAANADIAAITPIDFDHQKILGNTLAEIAGEKAAIIRKDSRVVVSNQAKEALNVILQRCAEFGVSPNSAADVKTFCEGETVTFQTPKAVYKKVKLSLPGRHQIENAKTAILAAEILQEKFNITTENIIEGLQTAVHRGRLEFYKNFLFDGAHNVSGAKALREYLDEFIKQPITMIFGSMRGKDISEIAEILFPKADTLILTKPENPRASETSEVLKFAVKSLTKGSVLIEETVENAVKKAREISSENHLILVAGSLYLVGEVQKILKNEFGI